jgi:ribosomal-protein-alanine N-acetyltransferase
MASQLETDRLLLRKPTRGDAPSIIALIGEWEVAKNLGRVPHPYTEADAGEFFDRIESRSPEVFDLTFGATLNSTGAYIGGCGVHLRENGEYELGYWIGKPYWGVGFASEAARAVTEAAFAVSELAAITAGYYFENPASGRVLVKLGFEPDGEEERDCRARGCAVRCHNMRLTRERFGMKHAA